MSLPGLPKVHLVDDDRTVRIAVVGMLSGLGYDARPFASREDLLGALPELEPGVLLLDYQLLDGTGLALIEELRQRDCYWPAALMTGHGDIPLAVQAIKLGAYEFLEKPVLAETLGKAIETGRLLLPASIERSEQRKKARQMIAALSPRQLQVFEGVVEGLTSKEIARRHGLSHRTVESYRLAMSNKLGSKGLADLFELKTILAEVQAQAR